MTYIVELKLSGRDGNLTLTNGERSVEAYVEISGSNKFDLLVEVDAIQTWSTGERLTDIERIEIKNAFESWSNKTNTRCEW